MGSCFRAVSVDPVDMGWCRVARVSQTAHVREDRLKRIERIRRCIGFGEVIRQVVVDTGHPRGLELHVLTDSGLVLVFNERSRRLVTILIARPAQVRRYYEPFGEIVPRDVLRRAFYNTEVHHWNV